MVLSKRYLFFSVLHLLLLTDTALCIRFPDRVSTSINDELGRPLKAAVFALGSFWRSEAVFGCLNGVVRTTVGYAGGSKTNPEFRNLGDHAESVQVSSFGLIIIGVIIIVSIILFFFFGHLFMIRFFPYHTITVFVYICVSTKNLAVFSHLFNVDWYEVKII